MTVESKESGILIDPKLRTAGLLRTFGRSTLWLWLDRGALRISNALAGLLLIRYLGPSNFGVYVTALAYGELVATLLNFGLNLRAARDAAIDDDQSRQIVAAHIAIAGVAATLELTFFSITVMEGYWELAAIAAGILLLNFECTAGFCRGVLVADLRSRDSLPGSILSAAGMLVVAGCVINFHLSALGLLVGLSTRSAIVASLRLWQIRRHWPSKADLRFDQLRQTIARTWPYGTYSLTAIGYQRSSVLLLGIVAVPDEVGLFTAAMVLAYLYPLWSEAWNEAILPLMTRLFENGHFEDLFAVREKVLDVLLFMSVPIAVLMSVFAPQICSLFGPRFAGSAAVLRILAFRSMLAVLDGFIGQAFLTAIGRVGERRNAQIRAFFILATLTLLLGSYWGARGAAVALLCSDLVLFLQYIPICRKASLTLHWPALLPSIGAGLAMALTAVYAPLALWLLKLPPSVCVYILVLICLARGRFLSAGDTLRECMTRRSFSLMTTSPR